MRYVFSLAALVGVHAAVAAEDAAAAFQKRVAPVLQAHCADCHGGEKPKAKLDLSGPRTLEQLRTQIHQWFGVLERVEAGTMPPKGSDPLTPADKQALAGWVRGEFTALLIEQQRLEGRSKLRRLSRNEYANTVQDLFGVRPPVVRLMPADGRVDGYDRVTAALPFSTASTDAQLRIAEETVGRMFELPEKKTSYRLWARASEQSKGHILELPDGTFVSFNTDTTSGPLASGPDAKSANGFPGVRKPGMHRLRISAYGYQTDKPLPVGIYAGHVWAYPRILNLVKIVEVPPGKPAVVEADVYLRTGRDSDGPGNDGIRLIPLGLGVPVPKNTQAAALGKGPGLALQWVDVEELDDTLPGQRLLAADLTPAVRAAFAQNATLKTAKVPREELEAVARKSFAWIGARLFRRDLTDAELSAAVSSCLKAVDAGSPLRAAFVGEVTAMMAAPDFLCVVERPGKLTDFALASRL